jgi:hypothetical protein
MHISTFLASLLLPQILWAQVLTQQQCEQTIHVRASLSISTSEATELCENNSMRVIECAISQYSSHALSGDLKKSLKRCRVEYASLAD